MPVFVFLDRCHGGASQGLRFAALGRERVHHPLVRTVECRFPSHPARPPTRLPSVADYVPWLKGLVGGLVAQGTDPRDIMLCGFREGASLLGEAVLAFLEVQLGGVVMIGGKAPASETAHEWLGAQGRDRLRNRSMPILAIHGSNDNRIHASARQQADVLYLNLGYHNYSSTEAVYLDLEQNLITDGMWMTVWQFVLQTLASEAPEPLMALLKMYQAHRSHAFSTCGGSDTQAVVWLHGITEGSEAGERLVQLVRSHAPNPLVDKIEFVFPSLMDTVRPKAGPIDATMWYRHMTMEQVGHPLCYVAEPVSFVEAVAQVVRVVDGLVAKGIPPERIVLGGWCQGASLALAALLFLDFDIGGCVCVSGYIPVVDTLRSWVAAHGGPNNRRNRDVPVRAINWKPDRYIGADAVAATYRFFRNEMAYTRWSLADYDEVGHEMTDKAWMAVWDFILEVLA